MNPQNPLPARVAVNRAWQSLFGTGLVKTPEDFGVQGERPSHPALLDWLATEFVQSGWDVKHLHRLVVTSTAYRQSSKVNAVLLERDPENRLMGIDHERLTYRFQGRDFRLTYIHGTVVKGVLA